MSPQLEMESDGAVELAAYPEKFEDENDDSDNEVQQLLGDDIRNSSVATPPRIDVPSSPASLYERVRQELTTQSSTAFPALQSLVMSKIPWFISLRFLGNIGGEELAAAALATTLHNVTGMSLSVGFSFALSTLAGQAKGEMTSRRKRIKARQSDIIEADSLTAPSSPFDPDAAPITPIVFLLRGMCIQLCLVLPVGMWWLVGIEDILVQLGQGKEVARMAASYLKILTPSLWIYSIQWTITCFLQTIGMADVPARAALLGLLLHVPFNWLFVYGPGSIGMGYFGCGVATAMFQVVQLTFLLTYLLLYSHGRRRLLENTGGLSIGRTFLSFWKELRLAIGSCRGILQYLGLALPGIVIISEWWASETSIFLSGRLTPNPEETLSGMTIYQSINSFCFMFPMAFAVSGTSRVGNLLGSGLEHAAAWAGTISVCAAGAVSAILGLLLFLVPHTFIPGLFAPNEPGVVYEASRTIPMLALYVIADGLQVALNGIIKGCGRQCVTMPIVLVAYWIVGVPLAYYLAFVVHDGESSCGDNNEDGWLCGDVGLVAAMTTGTWVHMLLLAMVVIGTTDWKLEARKAKERVAADAAAEH